MGFRVLTQTMNEHSKLIMLQNPHSCLPCRNFRISDCLRGRIQDCVTYKIALLIGKDGLFRPKRESIPMYPVFGWSSVNWFLQHPSNKCPALCAIYPALVSDTCNDSLFSVRYSDCPFNNSTSSFSFATSTGSSSVNNIPVSSCNPSFTKVLTLSICSEILLYFSRD